MKNLMVKTIAVFLLCLLIGNTFADAQTNRGRTQKAEIKTAPVQEEATLQQPERAVATVTTIPKGTTFAIATTQALTLEELESLAFDASLVTTVPVVLAKAIAIDKKTTIPVGTPANLSITFTKSGFDMPTVMIKLSELIFNKKTYKLSSNTIDASMEGGLAGVYESRAGTAASNFETEVLPDFRMNFNIEEPVLIGVPTTIKTLSNVKEEPTPTLQLREEKVAPKKTRGRGRN